MSKQEKVARGNTKPQVLLRKHMQLAGLMAELHSNLWGALHDADRPATTLKVVHRDEDYLAVLQRWNDDRFEVAFGSGPDIWSAMLSLSSTLARDAWKEDKYGNS